MISDWDCLDRARRGDEEAWRTLFHRHHSSLIRMASLITGSLEAGKDLAQETFVRLIRSRINHQEGNFASYISLIAYRLALKEKKRRQRKRDLDDCEVISGEPSPLEAAVDDERSRHLVRVIHSLSEHHRDILVLRFYREHSYEEIAKITRLPLGTVKSRIFHAVKTCREELMKRGIQ